MRGESGPMWVWQEEIRSAGSVRERPASRSKTRGLRFELGLPPDQFHDNPPLPSPSKHGAPVLQVQDAQKMPILPNETGQSSRANKLKSRCCSAPCPGVIPHFTYPVSAGRPPRTEL